MPKLIEFSTEHLEQYLDYWYLSDRSYLSSIGIDEEAIPQREKLRSSIIQGLKLSESEKQQLHFIIEVDGKAIGHVLLSKLQEENEASAEIHLWNNEDRHRGIGKEVVLLIQSELMPRFSLKKLIAQAYALNPAANQLCLLAGFKFKTQVILKPSDWHFKQAVNLYEFSQSKRN